MDEVVDELAPPVAAVAAHEVGASELVGDVDEGSRPAEQGGKVQGEGGLSDAGRARKVDRVAGPQVAQSPIDKLFELRG